MRTLCLTPCLTLCLAALSGCTLEDMASSWTLDRTRILAVQSEPAEPQPGDVVTFQALTWSPTGQEGSLWYLCLDMLQSYTGTCDIDPDLASDLRNLDWATLSDDELLSWMSRAAEAGVIGLEPGFSPTLPIPAELLDLLASEDLSEGLSVPIYTQAWPLDDPDSDVERSLKYLPISLAETPNHNPAVACISVDGACHGPGKALQFTAERSYVLAPQPAFDAIETYQYTNNAGEVEGREEEPGYRWYVTAGALSSWSPDEDLEDQELLWTAPASATEGTLVLVMLDGRGGMGWLELPFTVM